MKQFDIQNLERCCATSFGPMARVSCRAFSPSCGRPLPGRPNPRTP